MMSVDQENNKTPKWLKRLEKESWQAELLISGLALYGTLQLPVFVYWLTDMLLNIFPPNYYLAGYVIAFFYLFGIAILTTFFIIHFVLRGYWIGLIGLNSVYPEGYKVEDGFYSPIYSRLLAAKLPSIKETIKKVDKQCSTMFSGAFVFMLLYGSMSLSFTFILGIYALTKDFIPFFIWIILGVLFGLAVIVMSVLGPMSKSEKFRNNEFLQKIFFKMSYWFGNLTTPFFFKPVNQILFTYGTHAKSATSNIRVSVPFFAIAMFLSLFHLQKSNIGILINKGNGENINIHENTIYKTHYLDQYEVGDNIFVPVLESDVITDPFIKLFIPILRNESSIQDIICGKYEEDKSLDSDTEYKIQKQFQLDCYNKYITIKINDTLFDAELLRHNHSQGDRKGVLCYIPSKILSEGKNQIKVQKIKNTEQEIYDEYTINFWYAPSK